MKKIFFYSLLILVCISFFSVQNYDAGMNSSTDNSSQTLSDGWVMKLAPDTEKFYGVYFKTENLGGIFTGHQPFKRTTDGGVSWGYGVVPNMLDVYPRSPAMNENRDMIVPSYHTNGPNGNIYLYKTTDFGMNWTIAYSNGASNVGGDLIYLMGCYKQVFYIRAPGLAAPANFRNRNGGEGGWQWLTSTSGYIMPNAISYTNIGEIYGIFTNVGIGRSIIVGNPSMDTTKFYIIRSGNFQSICAIDSNNILATSNLKLFRSTNAGANWDSTTFPVTLNSISFPDQNTGYMTGSKGKIYKSTDKGATWYAQVTLTTDSLVDCSFLNTTNGYVIGYNGTLLKTTDGGGSMGFTVSGTARYEDNNQLITSGSVKAFRLNTQTNQIMILDSTGIQTNGSYILNNVPTGDLYIGAVPNSSPPADYVLTYYPSAIYYRDATILNPTENMTGIDIRAFRMSQVTTSNSVNGKVNSSVPVSPLKDANVYAKSGNTFVGYKTTGSDGIYHINSVPTGTLKIIADRIGYRSDSTTVNITRSNLDSVNFYLTKLTTGVNPISNNIPDKYFLYQNYPNPFNPSTNIKYRVPSGSITNNSFTSLKVYNILGKEIAILVNEKQSPGTYEINFDASSLPSGIYFYKIITDSYSETKRMILIK
jgi:hypothetical protein